ncbi:MAG: hypothetical protein AABY93_04420 [Bacteroidota bacterium]
MNNVFLCGVILFFACGKPIAQEVIRDDLFTEGEIQGKVNNQLSEASGLVASVNNIGYFWAHNDSGNPAQIFLIDQNAKIKLVCKFNRIKNRDWEDIAIGAGPQEGKNYIYVGDIGDNDAQYPLKLIYRFEEPLLMTEKEIIIADYDTLILKLPDGARDAEALMIDPNSQDMFLVSKREDSVRLYQMDYLFQQDTFLTQRIAILPFHNINAADISADGSEVLMKDYDNIFYWKKEEDESIRELLMRVPLQLPYKKGRQDEAIAWKRDGSGFYTLGETVSGEKGKLVYHKRK